MRDFLKSNFLGKCINQMVLEICKYSVTWVGVRMHAQYWGRKLLKSEIVVVWEGRMCHQVAGCS